MKLPDAVQRALDGLRKSVGKVKPTTLAAMLEPLVSAIYANPPAWANHCDASLLRDEKINHLSWNLVIGNWYMCSDGIIREYTHEWRRVTGKGDGRACFTEKSGCALYWSILHEVQSTNPQPGERWMTERGGVVTLGRQRQSIDGTFFCSTNKDCHLGVWRSDKSNAQFRRNFTLDEYNYELSLLIYGHLLYRVSEGPAREEPYINYDYAKLNALASEFLLLIDGVGFRNDSPALKKFMEFRNLAMTIAGKKHEQVTPSQPTPPDPVQSVLSSLDTAESAKFINGETWVRPLLHPKQIEGLKILVRDMNFEIEQNRGHTIQIHTVYDLFAEALS